MNRQVLNAIPFNDPKLRELLAEIYDTLEPYVTTPLDRDRYQNILFIMHDLVGKPDNNSIVAMMSQSNQNALHKKRKPGLKDMSFLMNKQPDIDPHAESKGDCPTCPPSHVAGNEKGRAYEGLIPQAPGSMQDLLNQDAEAPVRIPQFPRNEENEMLEILRGMTKPLQIARFYAGPDVDEGNWQTAVVDHSERILSDFRTIHTDYELPDGFTVVDLVKLFAEVNQLDGLIEDELGMPTYDELAELATLDEVMQRFERGNVKDQAEAMRSFLTQYDMVPSEDAEDHLPILALDVHGLAKGLDMIDALEMDLFLQCNEPTDILNLFGFEMHGPSTTFFRDGGVWAMRRTMMNLGMEPTTDILANAQTLFDHFHPPAAEQVPDIMNPGSVGEVLAYFGYPEADEADIRNQLKSVLTTRKVAFPSQTKDIHKLATRLFKAITVAGPDADA